jgi:hypothetical protein
MANATVTTYVGRGIMWNRLKGSGTEPLNLQWGDSAVTASAITDVNLFKPQSEARVAGTSSLLTNASGKLGDTYQVVGTITAGGAKTITEVGLFDTTTASPTPTLAASITAAATTMTISSASGLPTSGVYHAQIENEVVIVTGAAGTTLTIARGGLGTTSAIHAISSPVTIGGDGGVSGTGATTQQTVTNASITSAGGNCFLHADFAGIALASGDSINFTIQDRLT